MEIEGAASSAPGVAEAAVAGVRDQTAVLDWINTPGSAGAPG